MDLGLIVLCGSSCVSLCGSLTAAGRWSTHSVLSVRPEAGKSVSSSLRVRTEAIARLKTSATRHRTHAPRSPRWPAAVHWNTHTERERVSHTLQRVCYGMRVVLDVLPSHSTLVQFTSLPDSHVLQEWNTLWINHIFSYLFIHSICIIVKCIIKWIKYIAYVFQAF